MNVFLREGYQAVKDIRRASSGEKRINKSELHLTRRQTDMPLYAPETSDILRGSTFSRPSMSKREITMTNVFSLTGGLTWRVKSSHHLVPKGLPVNESGVKNNEYCSVMVGVTKDYAPLLSVSMFLIRFGYNAWEQRRWINVWHSLWLRMHSV